MQVGWDWASETHDVTVMDSAGQVVDRWSLDHDEVGLDQALGRLARHGRPQALPVAIETTNGVVVDRLLAAGHPVVPVHPNAFNATRPRWGAARAKSDPGDSWKLADYLRTDGHRLQRLRSLDAATRHLQALARLRDDHLEAKTAATNQLGALLDAHWPGAKAIFARLDSPIALAFLERYPTPQAAERLGQARLAAFLRRHSYSGHRTPAELLARLRAAPVAVNSLDPKVLTACVGAQVGLLRALCWPASPTWTGRCSPPGRPSQDRRAGGHAPHRPGQPGPDPGRGRPILDRARHPEHAAAEAGASPVTKQSGKATSVHFRWAANTRARDALATFADNSRHASPWAATLYRQARLRGKRHPQAVRILMRAWLRVMWACWHADTPYQVNHHRAERRLTHQSTAQG